MKLSSAQTNVRPVEVKIREKIGKDDVKTFLKFMEKNNLRKSLLITRDTETKFRKENFVVSAIPYWKYWSIMDMIGAKERDFLH